jgi:RNA recognition motif-containing protein
MSWTQVHVSGIQQELTLEDDALEETFEDLFELNNDDKDWAGPGTSTFKRVEDTNRLRGYAFLSFLSKEGAMVAVEAINNNTTSTPLGQLHAALSHNAKTTNSKPKNNGRKQQGSKQQQGQSQSSNASLRLRRRRAPPAPKHPVKSSSDTARLYRSMKL